MEEEQQYADELTFKKIWESIKRSGVRIIVYVLIGLIIAIGIMGVCNIILTKSQYETKITYYYSGVEDGNDPWGGQMGLVNNIRASSNVRNALAKCGYDDETIDLLVDDVIQNLSVIPSTANENKGENDEVISADYNYRIILTQNSKIDKHLGSRNEYNTIVSAITEEYINSFKLNYSMDTKLPAIERLGEGVSLNSLQNYDELRQYVITFATESASWQAKAGNFISPSEKESFSTLTSQIASLSSELDRYRTHILTNAINGNGEKELIAIRHAEYTAESSAKQAQITTLNNALKEASTIISTGSQSGTVILQTTKELQEEIIKVSAELAKASENKELWTAYQKSYTDNENRYENMTESEQTALYDTAISMANSIIDRYNTLLTTYQGMIKDYNDGYSINSLVRVTSGAIRTNTSVLTPMIFIIILAVVIIIAVIIAMCVTSKKGAMRIKALEKNKELIQENGSVVEDVANNESADVEVAPENAAQTE
ncbi:MAG: hypothetical protein K2I78_03235 [Clostridia bacterium]|nr:hypothetical protein [Clostridia bacterium]